MSVGDDEEIVRRPPAKDIDHPGWLAVFTEVLQFSEVLPEVRVEPGADELPDALACVDPITGLKDHAVGSLV